MRILLDTHAFLWAIGQPSRLSKKARRVLTDDTNQPLLSAVSLWEIALKVRTGKLRLPETPEFFVEHMSNLGIECLAIDARHVLAVLKLADYHRDPFDRLLVAQCQSENLPILTADPAFGQYGVQTIW